MNELLSEPQQWNLIEAIQSTAREEFACIRNGALEAYAQMAADAYLPHVRMRPKLSVDGNQWCALYGESLQDGVAGFGDSPNEAMRDFDANWHRKLTP